MGRSLKPLDWPQIELAIQAGVGKKKIAEVMNVDEVTLHRRVKAEYGMDFVDFVSSLQKKGETFLEVAMYQKALNEKSPGSVQMLIYLSKVRLGMREPDEVARKAPNEEYVEIVNRNMQLEHQNSVLKNKLDKNGNKSEAKSEL